MYTLRSGRFLQLFALGMILLVVSSCLPVSHGNLTPTQATQAIPTVTETTPVIPPTPIPTILPTTTSTPSPTAEPAQVRLGQPFWIGRGRIVDAVFLPGAKQVALAWGSGVLSGLLRYADRWRRAEP